MILNTKKTIFTVWFTVAKIELFLGFILKKVFQSV